MEVTGYKKYIAQKGDTWDILAFKFYEDEFMASNIMESNVGLQDLIVFEGGEQVNIPIFDTLENTETLAPWRR